MNIHPTAIISPEASLSEGVSVGPYCVIEGEVYLAEGVQLLSHVVIQGPTSIGPHTIVHPFASIGQPPQHTAHRGEPTRLEIGSHNQIREHVTIHRGTARGRGVTTIGSHCFIMVGCHIAHDCHLGSFITMANCANLGGHVVLEDHVVLGGLCGLHQFTRVGEGAMIGGFSAIGKDVIPYGIAIGNRGGLEGINIRKLKRLGSSQEENLAVLKAYEWLFCTENDTLIHRAHHLPPPLLDFPRVQKIQTFILSNTLRPVCTPLGSQDDFKHVLHASLRPS